MKLTFSSFVWLDVSKKTQVKIHIFEFLYVMKNVKIHIFEFLYVMKNVYICESEGPESECLGF